MNTNSESNSLISDAIMDRIVHHAVEIMIYGKKSMCECYGLKNLEEI